jgi:hypothetical protein
MPVLSSKHEKRESSFPFKSFHGGYTEMVSPPFLSLTQLSMCRNMKYEMSMDEAGQPVVTLKTRQGAVKISTTALSGAVKAATYYIAGSKYILATAAKLYYLDASYVPVEIGNISGVPTFTEFHGKLIIHDGGTTKAWNGTTFETLNNYVVDEVIGTGDGAETSFPNTFTNIPVDPRSITITYTSGTAIKTVTDDGEGGWDGDVTSGVINYVTGVFTLVLDAVPDNETSVEASYEEDQGAPKSKAGFVRGSQLYLYGDSDNPSRIWYSGTNDEDAWNTTSSGGYIDVDPDDGQTLIGAINFFTSLLCIKSNGLHRIDGFPGDSGFRVEPLVENIGSLAYRTVTFDGDIVSFLSKGGWMGMSASERFGDIQRTADLSKDFNKTAVRYADAGAYVAYNQLDKQLWLALSTDAGTTYLPNIYVVNMATGGQLSHYKFAFGHSCFSFVNGEMLIGGSDGHLYRLDPTNTVFKDNGVSYATDTVIRSGFYDFTLPFNRKHNKQIALDFAASFGMTATLNLFKNQNYSEFYSGTVTISFSSGFIADGTMYIADMTDDIGITEIDHALLTNRFNYQSVMWELENIYGGGGVEIKGLTFKSAVIGGL